MLYALVAWLSGGRLAAGAAAAQNAACSSPPSLPNGQACSWLVGWLVGWEGCVCVCGGGVQSAVLVCLVVACWYHQLNRVHTHTRPPPLHVYAEPEVCALLQATAALSAPGSTFVADVVTPDTLRVHQQYVWEREHGMLAPAPAGGADEISPSGSEIRAEIEAAPRPFSGPTAAGGDTGSTIGSGSASSTTGFDGGGSSSAAGAAHPDLEAFQELMGRVLKHWRWTCEDPGPTLAQHGWVARRWLCV